MGKHCNHGVDYVKYFHLNQVCSLTCLTGTKTHHLGCSIIHLSLINKIEILLILLNLSYGTGSDHASMGFCYALHGVENGC